MSSTSARSASSPASSSIRAPAPPGARAYDVFVDCLAKGVLIRVTGDIIALSPPLIIEEEEIDQIVTTLADALKRAA